MYFWRLEKLKAQLAGQPLSERQALPYLIVFVAMFTAVSYIPATVTNVWDRLGALWSVAMAVLGTIYIYRQNGGAEGQHFLQRYLAIGWVVGIRWLVIIALAMVEFIALLTALGADIGDTTWYEFLFVALAEAVVYWRIGYHVRDLAERTKGL